MHGRINLISNWGSHHLQREGGVCVGCASKITCPSFGPTQKYLSHEIEVFATILSLCCNIVQWNKIIELYYVFIALYGIIILLYSCTLFKHIHIERIIYNLFKYNSATKWEYIDISPYVNLYMINMTIEA